MIAYYDVPYHSSPESRECTRSEQVKKIKERIQPDSWKIAVKTARVCVMPVTYSRVVLMRSYVTPGNSEYQLMKVMCC